MNAIQLHDIHRIFRTTTGTIRRHRKDVVALDGLSLEVPEGELFGLLGPNGAGKTTTIKILTTLLIPTSGTGMVLGFDVVREAKHIRKRIGFVFGDSVHAERPVPPPAAVAALAPPPVAPAAAPEPPKPLRDCPECPELMAIPAGSFDMGSADNTAREKPVHRVAIAKPFALGRYEVSFDEYDAWQGSGVLGPEAFPPVPFLERLEDLGSPHGRIELPA